MRERVYILFDWIASGVSFLLVLFVYRESQNTIEVGESGWLLSLLTTSLFLSGASQYFAMFHKQSIYRIFLIFFPLLLVEALLLRSILNGIEHLVLSITIALNLYFAIFRGRLMGTSRLVQAALWNVTEQALRMVGLLFFLYKVQEGSKESLLHATLVAYLVTAVTVFIISARQENTAYAGISKEHIFEAVWYSVIHLVIYSLSNLDILLLKSLPVLKGEVALVKPWGQVLSVASVPFINVYLSKLQRNQRTTGILSYYAGFVSIYFIGASWLGNRINELFFHNPLPSVPLLLLVLTEHIVLSMLIISLYRHLEKRSRSFVEISSK